MNINFLGPLFPTDHYVQSAFIEILNIITIANSITDVNRMLINRNVDSAYGSLPGHFRWSFANNHFTLWQRTEYNSIICFNHRILNIHFGALASRDRERDALIFN